jgi:non-ribosomal peptide synthetase component F
VPIGHAIANVSVHVLDTNLAPVPVGIAGELYLGGVGLARGYHARPALTAERFVPRPDVRGERLYRTGDRARRRPDGALEYLGRNDAQVKIRGVRIELGEVEAQLRRLLNARAVAAVVHEDEGHKRLVAFVVPADGGCPLDDAQALLRSHLPDALVPARIIAIERLPLTASGKLDRRALPAPSWESERYVAPESEREQQLAKLWAETLGVARVGLDDDFFELGGHSLLATRLMARVEAELGIALPLARLFEATRLRAFAALVEQQVARADDGAAADRLESLMLELEAE